MIANLKIRWKIDSETPIYGLAGVDSETVPLDDVVRWARRLRRDLRRAIRERERLEATHAARMAADPVVQAALEALRRTGEQGEP